MNKKSDMRVLLITLLFLLCCGQIEAKGLLFGLEFRSIFVPKNVVTEEFCTKEALRGKAGYAFNDRVSAFVDFGFHADYGVFTAGVEVAPLQQVPNMKTACRVGRGFSGANELTGTKAKLFSDLSIGYVIFSYRRLNVIPRIGCAYYLIGENEEEASLIPLHKPIEKFPVHHGQLFVGLEIEF